MKNLKIRKKLFVVFSVIMVLFIVTAAVGIVCLLNVSKSMSTFYNNSHQVVVTQLDMRRALESTVKNMLWACSDETLADTQKHLNTALSDLDEVRAGLPILREKFVGDPAMVQKFSDQMDTTAETRKKIIQLAGEMKNEEMLVLFNNEYMPALEQAQIYLQEIGEASSGRATQLYESSEATRLSALITLITVVIVSLIINLLFGSYLTRSITNPVSLIEQAAAEMAKGNLDAEILYESGDELGSLANQMRSLMKNVKMIIQDEGYVLGHL